ncbi:DUF6311 domain-containing protein [Paenibacillus sp. GYB004]|uniref:DUF6311 domain-containing protein n=1 Tax=Paenibacillus sp. GYB004 TaxID=2994393 RepID=UPI002F96383E
MDFSLSKMKLNKSITTLIIFTIFLTILSIFSFKLVGMPIIICLIFSLILFIYEKNKEVNYPSWLTLLLGALLGSIFFISIFGWKILNPTYVDWLFTNVDSAQTYIGWHFFQHESWHFPPGQIDNLGYPIKTTIMFTNALPLFGMFFKIFKDLLPHDFQYIGIWILTCYILQGSIGALLIKKITPKISLQLISSIFFIVSPVMLFRGYFHQTLMGQWVLLFAILLIFERKTFPFWRWLFVIAASIYIIPYLLFCVGPFMVAHLFMLYRNSESSVSLKKAVGYLAGIMIATLFLLWIVGFFLISDGGVTEAYGLFSMNLNSLINPWYWSSDLLLNRPWSSPGQYEGFAYLGAGLILLSLIGIYIVIAKKRTFNKIIHWYPFIIVCIGLTILALTNTVTFDDKILLHINIGEWLQHKLGIFRSSGRLFWIVYYVIIFLILYVIIKKNRLSIAFALLIGASFIQYYDLHKKFNEINQIYSQDIVYQTPLQSDFWDYAKEKYNKLLFVPFFGDYWVPFSYYAASNKMAISIGYFSRADNVALGEYAGKIIDDVNNDRLDPDAVYIVSNEFLPHIMHINFKNATLMKVDGFNVLLPNKDDTSKKRFSNVESITRDKPNNLFPSFYIWDRDKNANVINGKQLSNNKVMNNFEISTTTINVTKGQRYTIEVQVSSENSSGIGAYIDINDISSDGTKVYKVGSEVVVNGVAKLSYVVPDNVSKIQVGLILPPQTKGKYIFSNPVIYQN